jgi:L-seryl-tRNA(Ser) seleniumtransferase
MKVGKEEAIGMLMAVEMWTRRDHKAEWSRWLSWLDDIAKRSRDRRRHDVGDGNDGAVEPHADADIRWDREEARRSPARRSRNT